MYPLFPPTANIFFNCFIKIDLLENWSLSYMTRDMCNYTAHPLLVATESDECKEQLNDLNFRFNNICAPKLNMLDNWGT